MGEFEFDERRPGRPGRDDEASATPIPGASSAHPDAPEPTPAQPPAPAPTPTPTEGPALPVWRVKARHLLTPEFILAEGEVEAESAQAEGVLALHHSMRERAALYAVHLQQLATFFIEDPDNEGQLKDADVTAMKIATGLRVTCSVAFGLLRDAYRAVVQMPLTFAYLSRGEIPEDFHRYLVRHARRLTDDQAAQVDAHLAGVELPSISRVTFEDQVRLAVELATAGTLPTPPSQARNVEIIGTDTTAGTASLLITGPIPEIHSLAHRLDVAARTVQKAQRTALEEDAEGPLPFDIDEDLRERGKALSLRTLRYAILTHSVMDIDPVQETARNYQILVTIPSTTLLGMDDSPAMLDGITPIPAELARELAGGEKVWYRILTDPITGTYLPAEATTYRPSAQMRLQLRLRHPRCAAPGCTRSTVLAAEDDHIIEYDHDDPGSGGQTSLWNLHRLCWQHHQAKTAGQIDPERDPADDSAQSPDGSTTAGPLDTTWAIGNQIRTRTREHTDLLTPRAAQALDRAWKQYQRSHEDALRLHAEEKARPHAERAAEDRGIAWGKRRRKGRVVPPGPPNPLYEGPPPF